MSRSFPKITFPNKIDAIQRPNVLRTLTAGNVNEIKDVVNSLADGLEEISTDFFSNVFPYSRFYVPTSLTSNSDYSLEVVLSDTPDFEDPITITMEDNPELFIIFENNQWVDLGERKLTTNDGGKTIAAYIKGSLDGRKIFFGKYRWKNITSGSTTRYYGYVLGSYDVKDSAATKTISEFARCYISGDVVVPPSNSDTICTYSFIGVKNDGTEENITAHTTFTCSDPQVTINGDTLTFPANMDYEICYVKAENTQDASQETEIVLNAYLPIIVGKASASEYSKIFFKFNDQPLLELDQVFDGDVVDVQVIGRKYNGDEEDITSDCTITTNIGTYANGTLTASGGEDFLGTIKAVFEDGNLSTTKYVRFLKNKIVDISGNIPSSIDIPPTGNDILLVPISLSGVSRKGNDLEVLVDDVQCLALNGPISGTQLVIHDSSLNLAIDSSKYNETIEQGLIFTHPRYQSVKMYTVKYNCPKLVDLEVEFTGLTDGSYIETGTSGEFNYSASAVFSDGTSSTLLNDLSCFCLSNPDVVVNPSAPMSGIIEVPDLERDESILLLFSLDHRGRKIEKFATVEAIASSSIIPIDLSASTSSIVIGTPSVITIDAIMSDESSSNVTDNVELALAFGNPTTISVNKSEGSITINALAPSGFHKGEKENIAFKATYIEDDKVLLEKFLIFEVTKND